MQRSRKAENYDQQPTLSASSWVAENITNIKKMVTNGLNSNTIIQCSLCDLKSIVGDAIAERLAQVEAMAEAKAMDVLLTPEQTEETLKISSTTLWRWGKSGYLTPIFIGGKKRFRRSDVMAFIEQGGRA